MFDFQFDPPIFHVSLLLFYFFLVVLVCKRKFSIKVLGLKNRSTLAFHVVRQLQKVFTRLDCIVAHHQIKERAENTDANGSIIAFLVVE